MRLFLLGLLCAGSVWTNEPKQVLIMAGKPSHGPGEHEFPVAAEILAKALNDSGQNLNVSVCAEKWTESSELKDLDVLVAKGAHLDERTGTLKASLHFATDRGYLEIAKLLLSNGADKNITATNGKTALDYAIELGNGPAELLLK